MNILFKMHEITVISVNKKILRFCCLPLRYKLKPSLRGVDRLVLPLLSSGRGGWTPPTPPEEGMDGFILSLGSLGRSGRTCPTPPEEGVDGFVLPLGSLGRGGGTHPTPPLKHLKKMLIFQGEIGLDRVFLVMALGKPHPPLTLLGRL